MMSLKGDKYLFIALVVLTVTFSCNSLETDKETRDLQVTSLESSSSTVMRIRHLLRSLFSNWNFGESTIEGRTFGRIRIMRKIMLPLAFLGGFLTAVIFSIKFTGLINMLLIKKVLLLQMALILGKIIYAAKEFLTAKQSFYPMYVYPHSEDHHGSFSHKSSYISQPDENFYQQPSFYSSAFHNQPQINQQQSSYPLNFNQPQPNVQWNSVQPQIASFRSVPMQVPRNVQFSQPWNQGQPSSFADSREYDSRFNNDAIPQAQSLIGSAQSTIKSLSPQEMTQLLSDAIQQVSSRTTPSPIIRRMNFNYRSIRRRR